ncbi:hypothetical protein IWQ60_012543 [Tieghemiomyces parasiticus]|uniref:Cytokinin riboside 5'-monophosphate phosphoribohydrolase n=1 Tax=Tieghemiomyces parasiticus TaxID=78921 RepID=A0A9W8DL98_9FUNG|nr:hypothetical protein IWQ60_012543 [Tieghemiomyces parasiticus]
MLDTNPRSRICVFCASSHGSHPEYAEQARGRSSGLGQALATRGYGLVYGLMGEVARAADEHGGDVLGIIPQALIPAEAQGNVIGRVIEVQDMHERKRAMNAKTDRVHLASYVLHGTALPTSGGRSMINIHAKPIVLINIRGYFDPLIQWTHLAAKGTWPAD